MNKQKILEKKIWKKNFEKKIKIWNFFWIFYFEFFSIFNIPASGKENVRLPDGPDFDNLRDFRTGRDVR